MSDFLETWGGVIFVCGVALGFALLIYFSGRYTNDTRLVGVNAAYPGFTASCGPAGSGPIFTRQIDERTIYIGC